MKEGLHAAVAAFCSRHIHRGDSRGPRLRLRLRRPAGRSLARSLAFADFARALVSGPGVGDYNMWLGISYYLSGDTPRLR